jgi:nucleoside-diphosphate-sugar epimerase
MVSLPSADVKPDRYHMHEFPQKRTAITGGSGYVGKELIIDLCNAGAYYVDALQHSTKINTPAIKIKYSFGDLLDRNSLRHWPPKGSTVVHLAYMWDAGAVANFQATKNLLDACHQAGIKRLVHVSTAAVVGRCDSSWVDEDSPCSPITEYGKTKLEIEEMIREGARKYGFDLVVLRPTSVYGHGGISLVKLCKNLRQSPWVLNYLKACLFARRAMNLVHLDNVIAAVRFFIDYPANLNGSTFILSDDYCAANNFLDVERVARDLLDVNPYPFPVIALPNGLLSLILRVLGRNIIDPTCRFKSDRLFSLGFHPPVPLEEGIRDYFRWYRKAELQRGLA